MVTTVERILILAKTYPSPSAKYTETSCVAGINELGIPRRLYPVPFRLVNAEQQFKKWQWIQVRIEKSTHDNRPESHRLFVDTIQSLEILSRKNEWSERRAWIEKLPVFDRYDKLDRRREQYGISLAMLRPKRLLGLTIQAADSIWSDEDLTKLLKEQMQGQGHLFVQEDEHKQLRLLRKLPFDFYYRYLCDTENGEIEYKHKIVDWEAGMLFWNCRRSHGTHWEIPFRAKMETDLANRDLIFLMGNIHRFQHQWLIISLIYPPRKMLEPATQIELF